MEETRIQYNTAVLAKEKGFYKHGACYFKSNYYSSQNLLNPSIGITKELPSKDEIISAPTQSLLQKWLRELHNIHISINKVYWEVGKSTFSVVIEDSYNYHNQGDKHKTYEEALEEGILQALNLIK